MNWYQFRSFLLDQLDSRQDSLNFISSTSSSKSRSVNSSIIDEFVVEKGARTRRVLNPAFYEMSFDNPLVQHFLYDRVTDIERGIRIGWFMRGAYAHPYGLAATLIIAQMANTYDQWRDLAMIAATGEIHGHQIFGESHH